MSHAINLFDTKLTEPSEYLPATLKSSSQLIESEVYSWFEEREQRKKEIEALNHMMEEYKHAIPYFSHTAKGGMSSSLVSGGVISQLFSDAASAINNLDTSLWVRLLNKADFKAAMTASKKAEWDAIIENRQVPEFKKEIVIPTINQLISMQGLYFAERVETVFNNLSPDHITNSPSGFGKRFIFEGVTVPSKTKGITSDIKNSAKVNIIDDLRVAIGIIVGRAPMSCGKFNTSKVLTTLLNDWRFGEWIELDGNALRIKLFKVGTVHVEVHPDVAYKLNDVLSMLYPKAIPAANRKPSTKKPAAHFKDAVKTNLISYSAMSALFDASVFDCRYSRNVSEDSEKYDAVEEADGVYSYIAFLELPESTRAEMNDVIHSLGGNEIIEGAYGFDYNPKEVFSLLVTTGEVPDKKDSQFYPTVSEIGELAAKKLLEKLGSEVGNLNLFEPSIGNGDLALNVPNANWKGVELSPLRAAVARARGFDVEEANFLTVEPVDKYDGVLMNPPFEKGQAIAHVLHATKFISKGSVLVAIVPSGIQVEGVKQHAKSNGFEFEESSVYKGQFDDAVVNVQIISIQK